MPRVDGSHPGLAKFFCLNDPKKSREKSHEQDRVSQERERVTSKRRERRESLTRPAGERGMVTRIGSVRFDFERRLNG